MRRAAQCGRLRLFGQRKGRGKVLLAQLEPLDHVLLVARARRDDALGF